MAVAVAVPGFLPEKRLRDQVPLHVERHGSSPDGKSLSHSSALEFIVRLLRVLRP